MSETWHFARELVHHNHPDCEEARSAPPGAKYPGTGGKGLCAECAALHRATQPNAVDALLGRQLGRLA